MKTLLARPHSRLIGLLAVLAVMAAPSIAQTASIKIGVISPVTGPVAKSLYQSGIGILLVKQNVQLALKLADHAYVMESGRIVPNDPGRSLVDDPHVREAYLDARSRARHPPTLSNCAACQFASTT